MNDGEPSREHVAVDPDDRTARLQRVADRVASRRRVPHVVMGVAQGDGPFHWVGAAGAARPDGTPMRPETPYFVASVTKLFIATTVMQLHEQGDVALDASITEYLPAEVTTGLHRRGGVDLTPRITVRNLLGHTSGLPDFLEDHGRGRPSLYDRIADGHDLAWDFDDVVRITRDELTPTFPPQDPDARRVRARYSDTGFQLLIAIIEAVTARSFAVVLTERFLGPLGMRHTYLPGASEPLEASGAPAELTAKGRPLHVPRALESCHDLVGTADDMLRFLRALTRGELFEDPATYRLMQARWNRILYPLRYGLGMMRYRIAAPFGPGRRAVTLVGHSGATGSWLFHCPELDLLLAGTVDRADARAAPFRLLPSVLRAWHG